MGNSPQRSAGLATIRAARAAGEPSPVSHPALEGAAATPLRNVERTMRRHLESTDHEEAAVISPEDGRVLEWSHGQPNTHNVAVQTDLAGQIALHTHRVDHPPSPEDVRAAAMDRVAVMRVVSPSHTYTVHAGPQNTWPNFAAIKPTYYKHFVQAQRTLGHESNQAVAGAALLDPEASHRAWLATARDLGFSYARVAAPEGQA